MSWLARLKNEKAQGTHATKATKPGFVGFVACQDGPFEKIGATAGAGEARSVWWRIHYPDRDAEVAYTPPTTRGEVLEWHPGAVAAEPFTPAITPPERPLTPEEEKTIRRWLKLVGENDPSMIAKVVEWCRWDADTRDCLIRQAAAAGEAGAL